MSKRRRLLLAAPVLLLPLLDLIRPPERQATARMLIAGIHLYQSVLSSRLASAGVACRFEPTCSRYAEGSIRRYGAFGGSWRSLVRLARCGPWTEAGTVDPP